MKVAIRERSIIDRDGNKVVFLEVKAAHVMDEPELARLAAIGTVHAHEVLNGVTYIPDDDDGDDVPWASL